MKYGHILQAFTSSVWAIEEDKLAEIARVLALRSSGDTMSAEDIHAAIASRGTPSVAPAGRGVAVIPIRGVIAHRMGAFDESSGGASAEAIGRMLSQVANDDAIGTVIYDVDSPGGTITGISELAGKMFALRGQKKQIAQVNGLAASAAYWLASQCDEIVCLPSGRAGSIGVFTVHADTSGALEKAGVKMTILSAGEYKVEGNPFEPLSEEARAFIQGQVDAAYAQFVKDVARGRGVSVADVKNGYGQGRALDAKAAKAAGLVDRIEMFDDTLARVLGRSGASLKAEDALSLTNDAYESDLRRRIEGF